MDWKVLLLSKNIAGDRMHPTGDMLKHSYFRLSRGGGDIIFYLLWQYIVNSNIANKALIILVMQDPTPSWDMAGGNLQEEVKGKDLCL